MSSEKQNGAPLTANGIPPTTSTDVDMTDGPESQQQPTVLPIPLPTSISQSEAPIQPAQAPSQISTTHLAASQAAFPPTEDALTHIQPQIAATVPAQAAATASTPPARSSPAPKEESSRASLAPPSQPIPNGSPARVYLNQGVTPHLLEGMKYLAVYEPEKPLKWLSEFLAGRSREVEGS